MMRFFFTCMAQHPLVKTSVVQFLVMIRIFVWTIFKFKFIKEIWLPKQQEKKQTTTNQEVTFVILKQKLMVLLRYVFMLMPDS